MTARRPSGVTLIAVLAYLSGAVNLVGGVLLLTQSGVPAVVDAFGDRGLLFTSAIIGILVGLVTFAVAGGLLRGNTAARAIITVVQVLGVLGGLWWLFASPGNTPADAIGVLLGILVLLLLWSRRANAFFRA